MLLESGVIRKPGALATYRELIRTRTLAVKSLRPTFKALAEAKIAD
jgi:hypothetical protein